MKRGDCEFLFSGNEMACKWKDNQLVLLSSSALEGMNVILSVQRREKSSKTKSSVPCPKVVKLYNSGICVVDLMDHCPAAYHLDRKSQIFSPWLLDCSHKKPNSVPSRLEKGRIENQPKSIDNYGEHLPDYQTMQKRSA